MDAFFDRACKPRAARLGLGLLCAACIMATPGCKKATPREPAPDPEPAEVAEATPSRPSHLVEFEAVSDEGLGYRMKLPKRARQTQRSRLAHAFSFPMPDGIFALTVNLTPAEHKSVEALARVAAMAGQKATDIEEVLADGSFLVVKLPKGPMQEVWVFRRGPTKHLTARCNGPSKHLDLTREVCLSLELD